MTYPLLPSRLMLPLERAAILFCLFAVQLLKSSTTWAHPGAVADGRATCGVEYSTADTAYEIPDITEAWYIRRVSTCESPVFWTKFDFDKAGQPLYIAVISPEIERFQDDLQFHAILYGPGVEADPNNGLSDIPSSLPDGIRLESDLGGAAYATHTTFDSCDFVDTNPVMKSFSDIIGGRCMEEFKLDDTFSDPLQQDTTSFSWWIYSYNHFSANPGTYYLQTWLTTRSDISAVAQGKYEMTLGPWTWYGYASQATLDLAQSQGTSCSCALNAVDYKEFYLERLGGLDPALEIAQLPGGSCSAAATNNESATATAPPPVSPCVTIPQEAYLSTGSAVEWSGLWESLEVNRTYEWTFRAYYQGANSDVYGYPDPGMYVHIVPSWDVESVSEAADQILTSAVEEQGDSPVNVVTAGDMLDLERDQAQYVLFTNTSLSNSTTVLIKVTSNMTTTSLAIFTQHVPSEFMAHVLKEVETGEYIFPTQSTLYVEDGDEGTPVEEEEMDGTITTTATSKTDSDSDTDTSSSGSSKQNDVQPETTTTTTTTPTTPVLPAETTSSMPDEETSAATELPVTMLTVLATLVAFSRQ